MTLSIKYKKVKFCLITTGKTTVDMIKQYIQSQGKKDGK